MQFRKPEYLEYLSEEFKEYFSEENFIETPYPSNLIAANKYVLFDVFKADKINEIRVRTKKNSEVIFSYPNSYTLAFNYDIWQTLSIKEKVILSYWWFKDECKKQNIYDCDYCFMLNMKFYGLQVMSQTQCSVRINPHLFTGSAYTLLSTISHEVNHCSFHTKEYNDYFRKTFMENKIYYSVERTKDYFYNLYSYLLYFFQPIEVEAFKYGFNSAIKLFQKNNKHDTPNQIDFEAIEKIKSRRLNQRILKKVIFKNNFKEHLDLLYLQEVFKRDLTKLKNDSELTKAQLDQRTNELHKNINEIDFLIQSNLKKFRKRFNSFINSNKTINIEREKEIDLKLDF